MRNVLIATGFLALALAGCSASSEQEAGEGTTAGTLKHQAVPDPDAVDFAGDLQTLETDELDGAKAGVAHAVNGDAVRDDEIDALIDRLAEDLPADPASSDTVQTEIAAPLLRAPAVPPEGAPVARAQELGSKNAPSTNSGTASNDELVMSAGDGTTGRIKYPTKKVEIAKPEPTWPTPAEVTHETETKPNDVEAPAWADAINAPPVSAPVADAGRLSPLKQRQDRLFPRPRWRVEYEAKMAGHPAQELPRGY